MFDVKLTYDGLKRRAKVFAEGAARARRDAVTHDGRLIIRVIERIAKRDTNRYVRAWLQAGNQAGLGPFTVPAVQKSKHWEEFLAKLEEQIKHFNDVAAKKRRLIDAWYTSKGRRLDSYGRKLESDAVKAEWRASRAYEELGKFVKSPSALYFGATAYVERGNQRTLSTVRGTIYGGAGSIVTTNGRTVLTLHNKEPHATIVERRHHTMAAALSAVGNKHARFQRLSKGYTLAFLNAAGRDLGGAYKVA